MKYISLFIALFISLTITGQMRFHHRVTQAGVTGQGFTLMQGGAPATICGTVKGVVSVSGGIIKFDIWQLPPGTICAGGITDLTPIGAGVTISDGRLNYGQPTRVLVLPFRTWSYGLNTLPFRLRPAVTVNGTKIPASGTTGFQLAAYVGRTWGTSYITTRAINNWSFTAAFFLGPATADLKKETVRNPTTWTTNQTNATLTYGLNAIIARNNIGIVLALGFERALGKNASEWIYNSEPYFGFGINTGFLR